MNGQNRPEDKVRATLEGLRAQMFLRFGEKKSKSILIGSLVALVAAVAVVLVLLLIKVDSIEVEGDVTMFNEGEIIAAAEISEGDRLFSKSSGKIKRNIKKNLPIADSIKVRKSLLGKVTISVEFSKAEYYCEYAGEYYALDKDLRVLHKSKTDTRYSTYGAVKVILPKIREPIPGEHIVFYYTVEDRDANGKLMYEVEDAKKYDYVKEFLRMLYSSAYYSGADGVILDEKFDVTLIYSGKYKIHYGDVRGLDVKFRVLEGILAEGSMQYADKVSIDLSDPSAAVARPDPKLDLSDFVD